MIKISVIIPIYNGESYLQECLDSICNQSLHEIEIICINDASKDSTLSILNKYHKKDNRFIILSNKSNLGAGASRNLGLDKAKGKYVIFLDADDVFEQEMLQEIYLRAENYHAEICVFREDQFCEDIQEYRYEPYSPSIARDLEHRGVFSPTEIKDFLFNLWNGWAWDKLFQREFILNNAIRFQEISSSEDGFFVHAALSIAKRITYLNQVYVHHRINRTTSLSNSRDASWECCYSYLHVLREYLIKKNIYSDYEKSFINWAPDFLYWNYWSLNEENRKKLFYALKQNILEEFGLLQYRADLFYNHFYYWFIHEIDKSDTYSACKIPVNPTEQWMAMLCQNESKIEYLFQYLEKHKYNAAIWGLGKRGMFFLNKYGSKRELKKIFDKDSQRTGEIINGKYKVELFNSSTSKGIDFIIVMNTGYFEAIAKEAASVNSQIKVFNLEQYQMPFRSMPLPLEDFIFQSMRMR